MTLLVRCDRPSRALRRDVPSHPRLRPLAEVLAERRAAVAALAARSGPDPAATEAAVARRREDDLDALARRMRPLAARVLGAVAEVAAGRRPAGHLAPVCAPGVLDGLGPRLAGLAAEGRRGSGPGAGPGADPRVGGLRVGGLRVGGLRVGGLRVCAVAPGVLEVAAVLHGDHRSRGVAARLERDGDPTAAGDDPAPGSGWRLRSLTVL